MNTKYLLSIGLIASSSAFVSAAEITVWATGVDPNDTSTYYNIRQGSNPTCWVASASNVIAHWQQNNAPGAPNAATSPEGAIAPQGQGVYDTYLSLYNSYTGGLATNYYQYWLGHHGGHALSGYNPRQDSEGKNILDTPAGLGGFYEDYYTTKEAVKEYAWMYTRTSGVDVSSSGCYTTELSKAIYQALSAGNAIVLDIHNSAHSVVLWGAVFDTETNLMTTAWVTDSSNWAFSYSRNMNKILVTEHNGKLIMDGDYYNVESDYSWLNYTIDDAHFLGISSAETLSFIKSGLSIPEPSAFGLFAGVFALVFAGMRRRRSR